MMNVKRILAFVLSLCMILTLAPVSAYAAETESSAASESQNLVIEELDGAEIEATLPQNGLAEDSLAVEQIISDDEVVKVLIIMESLSVSESVENATVNSDTAAISDELEAEQEAVVEQIEEEVLDGKSLDITYSYTWLLNGVAADVPYGTIAEILAVDGVKQVLIQPVYEVCSTADPLTVTDGVMVGRENTWAAGYTGEGMKIAIIDTGLDTDHQNFAPLGEDVAVTATADTVAAVLSELNAAYRYEGLTTGDVYYNTKVAYGFNYVDNNLNITHDYDDRGDHGTHVAGIAAANKVDASGVVGVAPNAQLYVMKVFGANGGAYTEDILAALEDALLLDADVVNMSLGSPAGFTTAADEVMAIYNRVADTNTVLSISAGNSYTSGYGNTWGTDKNTTSNPDNSVVGQPAVYNNVMSVASVENLANQREYIQVSDGYRMVYNDTGVSYGRPAISTMTGEYEFVFVPNYGEPADFEGLDLTGKVALIARGNISFFEKVDNAAAAGAAICIVYNNTDGEFGMDLTDGTSKIPAVSIMLADAAYLAAAQEADPSVTISFPTEVAAFPSATAYQMSVFSSWGVAHDLSLEPDITAPGGNIYSTINNGQYGLMSGTSMAAPNISGLNALVMEYIMETMPEEQNVRVLAQNLLTSTAAPLPYADGLFYSPRQQGTGLANAFNAVTTKAYLTVDGMDMPKVELGDDDAKSGAYSYSFNVHNFGDSKVFYDLATVIQTEGVDAYEGGYYFMAGVPMALPGTTTASSAGMVLTHDVDDNTATNSHDAYIIYQATIGNKAESYVSEEFRYDIDCNDTVNADDVQAYLDALVGNESAADLADESLCVAAGETAAVSVSVRLADNSKAFLDAYYPNGIYVEGFTFLDALNAGTVDLSLPYLAFYGDWDAAPILDTGNYWDYLNGIDNSNQYLNVLFSEFGSDDYGIYPGMNAYVEEAFDPAHISLSPNGDNYLDTVSDIYTSLLRNASELVYSFTRITDPENPEELYSLTVSNVGKTIFLDAYGQIVPEVYSWYEGQVPLFDWKDAEGNDLKNNDVILLDIAATGAYEGAHTEHWSVPVTIDLEAPQLLAAQLVTDENGRNLLYLAFRDNLSCSVVGLLNSNGQQIYGMTGLNDVAEDENGYQNYTVGFDITGLTGKLMIILSDYAINESYYGINLGGEGTPYGTLVGYSNTIGYMDAGWVSFSEGVNMDETMIFMDGSNVVAAEYVGGYVFAQTDNGALYGFKYEDMLKDTFVLESTFVAQLDNVYQDLAYSYAEGKLYGMLSYPDADGYPTTELFTINIGEAYYDESMWTEVGVYDELSMVSRSGLMGLGMAIDDAGTIYVMGNAVSMSWDDNDNQVFTEDETASLWSVGLEYDEWSGSYMLGWQMEKLGNVAQTMDYLQSMTWDHNTEKLYWARFDAPGMRPVSELYVVDPTVMDDVTDEEGNVTASYIHTEKVGDLSGEISGLFAPLSAEAAAKEAHLNIPNMDPEVVGTPVLRDSVITMNVTGTRKLTYDMDPWYTNYKDVVWSSSDETVVVVDENGVINCLAAGSAVITAANAADESKLDTVEIQVTALDLNIKGIVSSQGEGVGNVAGATTYEFNMVDGISTFETLLPITAPDELNYGLSLATSAMGRGSIWACEYGNTGIIYEIDSATGVVKDAVMPVDGDMMFGLSYSEGQDTFTGIMNMYIYGDLKLTAEESEEIMGSYSEELNQYTYHRINMLPYLRESGGNFMTGETGQGASSEVVFCGITTIEGGEATYVTKDYLGKWSSELNYVPTQTLVLLDNVGRLWFIDEIKGMSFESDEWGNAFYIGVDGSMIDAANFHGVEAIETSEGVYSVFVIRELAETPLTNMFREGSMPRITYHFSDIEFAGFTAEGAPMIIMSMYDYWNNGTTNELYLYIPGVPTGETEYDENWNVIQIKTPDRLYSLGNTGAYNIIASVHDAAVTGGVDKEIDTVQTEEEYLEELGIKGLTAGVFKKN